MLVTGKGKAQQQLSFLKLQTHKIQWANAVIKNALKTKDTLQLAEGWYLYGKIYEASGDYLTAKRYFMRSLRIQEKRGDSFELARLYYRFAKIENDTHRYNEALRYVQLSLGVAKRIGSDKALLRAYGEMVRIHATDWPLFKVNTTGPKPNYDSVLYYLRKIEYFAQRSEDSLEIAAVDKALGEELLRRKDPKAIDYFQKALNVFIQQNNRINRIEPMLNLAKATIAFGQIKRGYQLLRQAQLMYDSLPIHDYMAKTDFEKAYVQYYRAIGNSKMELEHTTKLHELEKIELNADREGAISRLSVEYETEKKEAQLKNQQKELALSNENQTIQRRFLVALSFLLIGAVVAIVVVYRLYRKNQQISRQNATLVREQNHRVKNNLQVVSSLLTLQSNRLTDEIAKSAVEDTQLRIEVMTILQRKLYDGDQLASVRLLEFIAELLEIVLQTFDYEHVKITYDISATLEVSMDHALRIGLIVNELATNACKYAFTDHPHPKFSVTCSVQQGVFEMKVADNGKGFKQPNPSNNTKKMSFGMRLIQIQVEQLYGTYHFYTEDGTVFQMQFRV
jgi:two-component sensor histidine kinase